MCKICQIFSLFGTRETALAISGVKNAPHPIMIMIIIIIIMIMIIFEDDPHHLDYDDHHNHDHHLHHAFCHSYAKNAPTLSAAFNCKKHIGCRNPRFQIVEPFFLQFHQKIYLSQVFIIFHH